jgi:hypothetical protein
MCLFWQNWNAWQYENADGMTALLKISKQMWGLHWNVYYIHEWHFYMDNLAFIAFFAWIILHWLLHSIACCICIL